MAAPTTGQMIAAIASEWGAVATSKLFWDDTNTRLGIGTATPRERLEIRTPASSATGLLFTSPDISHGLTTNYYDDLWGYFAPVTSTTGGMQVGGLTDSASGGPLRLIGIFGDADPTDTIPAVAIAAYKKDGTTTQALANAETIFAIRNATTAKLTVLGNGYLGIGTATPGHALDVVGQIRLSGTHFVTSDANLVFDRYNATGAFYWRNNATAGDFSSYNTLMTLDNSAKLAVSGNIQATGVPTYASNAAAIAGGLVAGDFYKQFDGIATYWLNIVV